MIASAIGWSLGANWALLVMGLSLAMIVLKSGSRILATPQQGVESEPPGSGHEEQQEPTDDRQVLEKLTLLCAPRSVGKLPIAVRDPRRDYYKQYHQH